MAEWTRFVLFCPYILHKAAFAALYKISIANLTLPM